MRRRLLLVGGRGSLRMRWEAGRAGEVFLVLSHCGRINVVERSKWWLTRSKVDGRGND